MENVTDERLRQAYKPFDIVTDEDGNVGYIQETSINPSQPDGSQYQIQYSVNWLVGKGKKHAWYSRHELVKHGNFMVSIAESMAHPFGNNTGRVKELFAKGIL